MPDIVSFSDGSPGCPCDTCGGLGTRKIITAIKDNVGFTPADNSGLGTFPGKRPTYLGLHIWGVNRGTPFDLTYQVNRYSGAVIPPLSWDEIIGAQLVPGAILVVGAATPTSASGNLLSFSRELTGTFTLILSSQYTDVMRNVDTQTLLNAVSFDDIAGTGARTVYFDWPSGAIKVIPSDPALPSDLAFPANYVTVEGMYLGFEILSDPDTIGTGKQQHRVGESATQKSTVLIIAQGHNCLKTTQFFATDPTDRIIRCQDQFYPAETEVQVLPPLDFGFKQTVANCVCQGALPP